MWLLKDCLVRKLFEVHGVTVRYVLIRSESSRSETSSVSSRPEILHLVCYGFGLSLPDLLSFPSFLTSRLAWEVCTTLPSPTRLHYMSCRRVEITHVIRGSNFTSKTTSFTTYFGLCDVKMFEDPLRLQREAHQEILFLSLRIVPQVFGPKVRLKTECTLYCVLGTLSMNWRDLNKRRDILPL